MNHTFESEIRLPFMGDFVFSFEITAFFVYTQSTEKNNVLTKYNIIK